MKTLMILGALEEFVSLVRLAKKQNIRTVVVDGYEHAPAKRFADAAYTVDVRDIKACAAIADQEKVDAITTAYSDLLLECMVKIADMAKLPCHLTPAQLPYYRDKHIINATCEALQIPTPKSVRLAPDFCDDELSSLAFPMVIKPLDLYGSRGLVIVHSVDEIHAHFADSCALSDRKEILAEEYNPEYEFNIQCWVRHGQVHVLGLADREKTSFDPHTVPLSTRNIYPSRLISHVYDKARDALQSYIRHTGQTEGPLAMQFYWGRTRGFEVGEIAARFLGYEHELIAYSSNLSIEALLLAAAVDDARVDELLAGCNPFGSCSAAVLYLHARDGVVADTSGINEALQDSSVVYGQIFYQKGDRVGDPQTQPYAARYDMTAPTRDAVDVMSEHLLSIVSMKDTDGTELLRKGILTSYKNEAHYD